MLKERLTQLAVDSAERGWIPDSLLRYGMRKLCEKRLRPEHIAREEAAQFATLVRQGPIALVPEKANEQHYEVPAEFFDLVLGPRRKYSCCFYPPGVTDLATAEEESLRQSCEHAQVADGQEILELGCGWGSLTLWLLEKYPQARITAVSNSSSQRQFIRGQAEKLGFSERLQLITADMNQFSPPAKYDRVMSIEMFEHMRNYEQLLHRIRGWLRPGGKLFVHIFCHRWLAYDFDGQGAADWMSRNFFSGGIMPSVDFLSRFPNDLRVEEQWIWNGEHYAKTADAWVENLDRRQAAILPILAKIYGPADARRWWQRWRMLFLAGSELFGYKRGEEWLVGHYRLAEIG